MWTVDAWLNSTVQRGILRLENLDEMTTKLSLRRFVRVVDHSVEVR